VLGSVIVISRVASLPVGLLIDRIGADRLLMAATTTFAVALALLGLLSNPIGILIAAAVQGAAGASQQVGFNAAMARRLPPDQSAAGFGLMSTANNIGIIVGPLATAPAIISGHLGEAYLVSAALSVASAIALFGMRPPGDAVEKPRDRRSHAMRAELPRLTLLGFVGLYLATGGLLQQVAVGLAQYAQTFLLTPAAAPGFLVSQAVLAMVLVPVAGGVMKDWPPRRLFASYGSGTFLLAVAYLAFAATTSRTVWFGILVAVLIITLSEMAAVPAAGALVAAAVSRNRQGGVFGLLSFAQTVGLASGAALGGVAIQIAAVAGSPPLYWLLVSALFGGIALLSFLIGWIGYVRRIHSIQVSERFADGEV
jgi:MFS family permease